MKVSLKNKDNFPFWMNYSSLSFLCMDRRIH